MLKVVKGKNHTALEERHCKDYRNLNHLSFLPYIKMLMAVKEKKLTWLEGRYCEDYNHVRISDNYIKQQFY